MKINSIKFGIASAFSFFILWIICSLLVIIMPAETMKISSYMLHADLSSLKWNMKISGLFIGLISWTITAGIAGWLIATIYNKLLSL